MSRGVYRGIYSALPDDPDFQRLAPDARLTLLVARLCSQAGPAAIFRYYPALLCAQTGLTARRLESALGELERGLWIYREGVIIWIRNGLRHDPCTHLANANHKKSVVRWLKSLPRLKIVLTFCDYYSLPYPFDSPSNGLRIGSETKDSESDTDTESDTEPPSIPPKGDDALLGFEEFWRAYPNHKARAAAEKAWCKCRPPLVAVLVAIKQQRASPDWTKEHGRFVPYPATWLNGQRWRDEFHIGNGHARDVNDAWKGKTHVGDVKL
jgi:hypothetical protein